MTGRLQNVTGAADPVSVLQANMEVLDEEHCKLTPTYESGIATTVIGPPTSSASRILNEIWIDSLGAKWRCTVAGTPGTWRQETPATVATPPATGTIPNGYWIKDEADNFREKYQVGLSSYVWRPVYPSPSHFSLTGLTGGTAGNLDAIPTVGLAVGIIVAVVLTSTIWFYILKASSDAESSPTTIRPDDYNGITNLKVWHRLTVGT